ncbi:MAG: hypothetical protein IKX24_08065 [Prevotella sp.]|nr:hypothetical protein [Prevotella sp.]
MKKFLFTFVFSLLLICVHAQDLGQTTTQPKSRQWKGIDVTTVLGNSEYETVGKTIFLYNVGTGRFIIEGGNWGIEGRLFHDDFGRELKLLSNGFIGTDIVESTNQHKKMYGCNVPGVSKPGAAWEDKYVEIFTFTTIMDAPENYLSKWEFQRVETDPKAKTYTYYMWEKMKGKNYYLGTAWGEFHHPSKGDGQFVDLDHDRACWTTANVIGNETMMDVNGKQIPVAELYQ